jgi:hypothetical protein
MQAVVEELQQVLMLAPVVLEVVVPEVKVVVRLQMELLAHQILAVVAAEVPELLLMCLVSVVQVVQA